MPGIFVTGANGFVGQALCARLREGNDHVVAAVRSREGARGATSTEWVVGDLAGLPNLSEALADIDCVVHLAARAHVMRDRERDPELAFQRSNVLATRHIAQQAAAAHVKRLIFLSSVKVQGERSSVRPLQETDLPNPLDAYARSKLEAEHALHSVAAETGLEVVIIRPPLIYGAGVKANFLNLTRAVASGLPLPLASVDNRRSLVSVWNLCDLIHRCIAHPGAAGETFLVADGRDLSTPELVRSLGRALGRPARLFPVPPTLLRIAGRMLGRGDMVERLIGSLQVDRSKAVRQLGWCPPLSIEEGLTRTARWYLETKRMGH